MSALSIQELTGSQRSITLRGWALPERGPGFGGTLRYKRTWYAGNQQATLQVLGPEVDDTDFTGYWMDRHIADPNEQGAIEATGFGEVRLAVDLVRVFETIRDSGNRLRVQWGPFVRNGILASFEPMPEREQDIKWSMSFAWDARDDAEQPRATVDEAPDTAELREAQNASDDQQAFAPPALRTDYFAQVRSQASDVRRRVGDVFDRVRAVQGMGVVPLGALQELVSDVEALRDNANALGVDLIETFLEGLTDSETLFDVLRVERWRRTQAFRVARVLAQAQSTERTLRALGRPEPIRVVSVQQGESLRSIAFREYGTSDEWQRIAAANSLPDSVVAVGTLIVVPPLSAPIDTTIC